MSAAESSEPSNCRADRLPSDGSADLINLARHERDLSKTESRFVGDDAQSIYWFRAFLARQAGLRGRPDAATSA